MDLNLIYNKKCLERLNIKTKIISFFYKFTLIIGITFFLLSLYLNISKMFSDDSIGSYYMDVPRDKNNDLGESLIYSSIMELGDAFTRSYKKLGDASPRSLFWYSKVQVRMPTHHDTKEEVETNYELVQTTVAKALSDNVQTVPKGLIEIYDEKIAKIDNLNALKGL